MSSLATIGAQFESEHLVMNRWPGGLGLAGGTGSVAVEVGAFFVVLTVGVSVFLYPPAVEAQGSADFVRHPMEVRHHVQVPLRDGVHLSADVYRPPSGGPHPAVFTHTPYNNNSERTLEVAWSYVRRGYAYVITDARGRHDSEGEFFPYRDDGRDGSDVMDWIAEQPWSNGRIVTLGGSYTGKNQWLMAREGNPHHEAIVSYVSGAHEFLDGARFNGVPKLDLRYTWIMGMDGRVNQDRSEWRWDRLMWELPLVTLDAEGGRDIPAWRDLMRHDSLDAFWHPSGVLPEEYEGFDIPSFSVTGWYEGQLKGAVQHYTNATLTADDPDEHTLIVGPWLHGVNRDRVIGERDAGPDAIIDLDGIRDAWMDHRFLGRPGPDLPQVAYFVPGRNVWRGAERFPVPGTQFTEYYLDSGGQANTLAGDGRLENGSPGSGPPDRYSYDPKNPVLSVSSRTSGARGGLPQGSVDNRAVETRSDVLVYTSETLSEGLEVTGPVRARIYFSTDVEDTDITVKLLDVLPDGRAHNITEGIARAKYRNSYRSPDPLEPGEIYALDVELFPTSNWFAPRHRIRVEVSSSDFPNFARNLGHINSDTGSEIRAARTQIHHSPEYPSHIVLPVVPEGATVPWSPNGAVSRSEHP